MAFDSIIIVQILLLFLLIGFNAFFAASEIAIISLNDNKIKQMAKEGNKKAKLLESLINEPSKFLATIQVGITLAGLLASALAAESFADKITIAVMNSGLTVDGSIIKTITVIIITIVLAYFQLVLGELVPKRIAMQKPEAISMLVISPISLLSRITSPFIRLLSLSTNFVIRLFGGNPSANDEKITEEDIRMMVNVGQEKGVIQGIEKEMINNIFEFDNTSASEIMTPRTDILAIPLDADFEYIIEIIRNEKYTRIPVYEETIDDIVGILHIKDMFDYVNNDSEINFNLKDILRTPYFTPQSKKTDELFRELQKNKTHIAIVIDEYGGTAGLITIEDLLEEIVGSIFDEYDQIEKEIDEIDENTFIFDGLISLDKVKKHLHVDLPVDEYDTLNGFLMGQLGRIPGEEEKPEIEFNGIVFKIENVDEKRISKVKACRTY